MEKPQALRLADELCDIHTTHVSRNAAAELRRLNTVERECNSLRVSVARLAQAVGADNSLSVTDKPYEELCELARTRDRGWNDLCARILDRVQGVLDDTA